MADDPFANVWTEETLGQARDLLRRTVAVLDGLGLQPFLDFGTLLGFVREGRILAWDDDVDLAIFQPVDHEELTAAFADARLVADERLAGTMVKVWDPSYEAIRPGFRTWPFIDLFLYRVDGEQFETGDGDPTRLPLDIVLPGSPVLFEGSHVWLHRSPRAVLDVELPRWHRVEISPAYTHRYERGQRNVVRRRIETDANGRKIRELPARSWVTRRLAGLRQLLAAADAFRRHFPQSTPVFRPRQGRRPRPSPGVSISRRANSARDDGTADGRHLAPGCPATLPEKKS